MMYGFPALCRGLGEGLRGHNASGMISAMDPEYEGVEVLDKIG